MIIKFLPTPINIRTGIATVMNLVYLYSKMTMCNAMRLFAALPGGKLRSYLSYLENSMKYEKNGNCKVVEHPQLSMKWCLACEKKLDLKCSFLDRITGLHTLACRRVTLWPMRIFTNKTNTCNQGTFYFNKKMKLHYASVFTIGSDTSCILYVFRKWTHWAYLSWFSYQGWERCDPNGGILSLNFNCILLFNKS